MATPEQTGTTPLATPRLDWVDTARASGMFLVFYGHFVEDVFHMGNEPALLQQKLVYAFHMPLFIFISGFLAKTRTPPVVPFLKKQVLTRLLPFLTLSVAIFPFHLLDDAFPSDHGPTEIRGRYVRNWQEFCARLAPPAEDQALASRQRLWAQLPAPAQGILSAGAAGDSLGGPERDQVITALNALLDRPDLFTDEHFAGVDLPEAAREQLQLDRAALTDSLALRHANWTLAWWTLSPDSRHWSRNRSAWGRLREYGIVKLQGWPTFNIPTWFLLCLFVVELIHYVVARFLTSTVRIAAAIPLFAVLGWFATVDADYSGGTLDIWFSRESLFLYSFYLLGLLLRRLDLWGMARQRGHLLWGALVSAAVLLLTFDLNPGSPVHKPVVLINLSKHGDPLWFGVTAVAGCLAIACLARLAPSYRLISYVGRHSLLLMGMNGLFFHFGNERLLQNVVLPASHLPLMFWCTVASLGTMALSIPLVRAFERYLPQLVGQPRVAGPWLPALLRNHA